MPLVAITREITAAILDCELTHLDREPIDVDRARRQHLEYEDQLRRAGCRVEHLPAGPEMPDAVFIEDTAVVLDEVAIVTRPGAPCRRVETAGVAEALGAYRELRTIQPPGTLDGGDVLVMGKQVFIGRSKRTNTAAVEQMTAMLAPFGYEVTAVNVRGCLHLKSAVSAVGESQVLVNPDWLPDHPFDAFDAIAIDPLEAFAANALRIGTRVIYPISFPRTLEILQRRGLDVHTVDASELQKAEGAVTCCSLVFAQP